MTLPDDLPVLAFPSAAALGDWLAAHHAEAPGFWLKIPKKGSGIAGPTYSEALDEALRFGWIDSQKASIDADFYAQRFTPRGPRSRWSKVNRRRIEALQAAGRLEAPGRAEVERAQADGRWDAAYDPPSTATTPPDLQAALEQVPEALRYYEGLSASSRFTILYRVQDAKQAATRARRIAQFVDLCARGEPIR